MSNPTITLENEIVDIGNNCTQCGKDTSFGSGRFVNRIPSTTDTQEGYMCPDCQAVKCDECDQETLEYLITEAGNLFCSDCLQDVDFLTKKL